MTRLGHTGTMRLKDKVILVTGSATGIGEAIVKRIVSEGGLVVVHGLEKDLVAHVSEYLNAYAQKVRGEQCTVAVGWVEDLTVQGCPDRLVQLAVDSFGRLDGLVNNAAVVATGDIFTTDTETFIDSLIFSKLYAFSSLLKFLYFSSSPKSVQFISTPNNPGPSINPLNPFEI